MNSPCGILMLMLALNPIPSFAVTARPGQTLGPSGSGGGGPQAGDFTTSARLIGGVLHEDPKLTDQRFGVDDFATKFDDAVDHTDVVCADDKWLAIMRPAVEKAHFDSDTNSIYLDCANYDLLKRMGPNKYVVVFHEYMRKLQLEGSNYIESSKLLLFPIPAYGRRAIDAFCEGGYKDKFQLENYITQMLQEKTLDADGAKMLREGSQNNIQFPDAAAREIATWLGWTKNNQYEWIVELTCSERNDLPDVDFNDDSLNDQSILKLDQASGAFLKLSKSYTIRRGKAEVSVQNGKVVKIDDYQPYCTFAHDTDPQKDDNIQPHAVKSGNIEGFSVAAVKNSPATFNVNFSIVGDTSVTDIAVSMPGDIGTVARLRSVLKSCGVTLNLKGLLPPIPTPSGG